MHSPGSIILNGDFFINILSCKLAHLGILTSPYLFQDQWHVCGYKLIGVQCKHTLSSAFLVVYEMIKLIK